MRTGRAFGCVVFGAVALGVQTFATGVSERRQAAAAQAPVSRLATAADQIFSNDGVSLRYREFGGGEPVLLIHGYTANLESLAGLGNVFAEGHRVIGVDVRGFGKSSKFSEPARFGQLMVDDVVRLLDHLQIRRAHVVGHSMGALIAANVASRYPERVSSATLIAGPFYSDKPTFAKEVTPWITDLESGKGLVNFMQWLFPRMDPKMAAGFSAQSVKANDLPSLIAVMRSLPDLAITGVRAQSVKSLVAVGTADPLHPLSGPFVKSSADARLLELEGADHLNVLAKPELTKAMRELIQSAATASKPLRDAA